MPLSIWAHRASLCTTSPFFRALFRFEPGRIVLLELRAPVLEALLTFCFTEELPLNDKNTLDILDGADMPPMQEALNASTEYPKTSPTSLRELLSSDDLNVVREADLLCALQQWSFGRGTPIDDIDGGCRRVNDRRIGICNEEDLERVQQRFPSLAQSHLFQEAVDDVLKRGYCRCSPELKPQKLHGRA
ncbi:hypothetical protein HPB48_011056 [Haemaphysalis longicornis]|uniref:BTB domain-containing protein n=1 Tax=Haemaphysalis longicornis TaxID=44386 RepID=A0A9J6FCS9_HAELO|nr:hypothetical protein HPB48_011056 [Haemaphysalis longicornis]